LFIVLGINLQIKMVLFKKTGWFRVIENSHAAKRSARNSDKFFKKPYHKKAQKRKNNTRKTDANST